MNAIRRLLWGCLLEPYAVLFNRRTVALAASSFGIWRRARTLFRSSLSGERIPIETPARGDWKLRTVIYGFGNVATTCRGSPAAIDREQFENHWDSVRAHFAPFEDLLQLVARVRALALALFYPATLVSTGLFHEDLEVLVVILILLVTLWMILRFAIPALVRWRLRVI